MTEAPARRAFAARRRVFFAFWPDAPARARLEALARDAAQALGGRAMRADSLHVTLAFIGEVDDTRCDRLREIGDAVRAPAFRMTLDRCGLWRHNGIFQAGCHEAPSGEARLFAALAAPLRGAGFALDARPHLPHVTLVRKAGTQGGEMPVMATPIAWEVDAFTLVESTLAADGSRYRIRARWPLQRTGDAAPGSDAGIG